MLNETPQIIPSLSHYDVKHYVDLIYKNINKAKPVETITKNSNLYHLDCVDGTYYFVLNNQTNKIGYFVRYKLIDFRNFVMLGKAARQVMVCRLENTADTIGIADKVFWILYSKFGCLVSDSEQTPDGKKFWMFQIKKAIESNKKVLLLDTNDNTQIEVGSIDELEEIESGAWGSKTWFKRKVVAIV